MSFNAPFTTISYYSWLFENDGQTVGDGVTQVPSSSTITHTQSRRIGDSFGKGYLSGNALAQESFSGANIDPEILATPHPEQAINIQADKSQVQPATATVSDNMSMEDDPGVFLVDIRGPVNPSEESHKHSEETSMHSTPGNDLNTNKITQYAYSNAASMGPGDISSMEFNSTTDQSLFSVSGRHEMSYTAHTSVSQISTPPGLRSASVSMQPWPDAYTPRGFSKLPVMTNEARDGLMQVISQARPTKPDGFEIVSSDPLLSITSLQHYSDLFFTRFNSSYPLIHQATFKSDEVHTYLLMSILLLGATYSDKEAHLLAVCIHDIMRPLIHGSKDFGTRPKLWMLQTILLVECFGKSRAGEKQHDMSHLYHGMLINLIRRSDCQSAIIPPFEKGVHDPQEYWNMAVEAEQKRRYGIPLTQKLFIC
jgi:hypothetical protein